MIRQAFSTARETRGHMVSSFSPKRPCVTRSQSSRSSVLCGVSRNTYSVRRWVHIGLQLGTYQEQDAFQDPKICLIWLLKDAQNHLRA